ncbi:MULTISPECIES: Cof-type HAD-IIB family hydrolase [Enterococcus]|uniref:Cof-type HAD-IIB family hydrolase n=1 Tax=Enterococcus TaxID=1350 RepID=UPI000EC96957|nr:MULTISPECIES: Cof-type HAD-IIB family hydrolase [Enterococcus]HCM87739.1 hypothetical protein [Enterococcus sp.]
MPNHKIAFFDVDGTLVDPKMWEKTQDILESIPDSTRIALKKLKENKIAPVIATGRPKKVILPLAKSLGVENLITSNGQEIVMGQRSIFQNYINPEVITAIHKYSKQKDAQILYDTSAGLVSTVPEEGIELLAKDELPQKVLQILINTQRPIEQIFPFNDEVKIVKSGSFYYDVLPKNISKASAIARFLQAAKVPVEQTLAFGDEENDLEMFEYVGTSIAMGNATKVLKERANQVTKEVWNDGIYYACEKLKLF